MKYDVIIIGGGPGGLSAALWCDDLGLEALLLESGEEFGGQLLWTHNAIGNHLGTVAKNGREMRDIFIEQMKKRHFVSRLKARAAGLDAVGKQVSLVTGELLLGRALIVASGVRRRKLDIEGEDDFAGRGVLTSGTFEKDSVAGRTVIVIGGGDAALENALILSATANRVFLVHRRMEFRAREDFVNKARSIENITILTGMKPTRISGNDRVASVGFENAGTGDSCSIDAEAVVIRIGFEPNTEFLGGQIELDEGGYIKINSTCETSVSGVYAIGDAANRTAPTVSAAIGMGAISVKSVYSWLNR